ncbi:MAG: aminotransferase class V-fold PLP-dependent enzyme [Lentihominibacter sp.]
MIYFDNAATTMKKPPQVVQAVTEALCSMGNSGRGSHDASLDASRVIYDTRVKLAELFNAENPSQIAFAANATEALNIAIKGILSAGDHVITTALEHNSVLRPLYEMEERGVALTIISADSRGNIDCDELEKEIRPDTKAIICTHASNLTGNLVDIARVGGIAAAHNVLFVVDASQTAGVFPVDVQKMNIDILCFTGHKSLMGPQGTGGIYVREGVAVRPLLSGGSGVKTYSRRHPEQMPTALEAGTLNAHGIAGLGAAVKYICETGIDAICEKEHELMCAFYDGVREIPGIRIYGDFTAEERAPIVSLNIRDYESAAVSNALAVNYGIYTRSGGHCAPLMHQALGTAEQGAVRFSFSYYNTMEEVCLAVSALKELAEPEETEISVLVKPDESEERKNIYE